MANAILTHRLAGSPKEEFLSQYKDIANQDTGNINRQNLSYTDSPIFQKGYEAWNPIGLGSKVLQSWSIPVKNLVSDLTGKGMSVSGAAGIWGSKTAAGFENELIRPILEGTATTEQKQDFANVFGHEMSHLGWDYKPSDERISVPGVGTEGSKASGIMGSDVALGGDYGGEEQWNYLHDLMYGQRVDYKQNMKDLEKTYQSLPKGSPERKEAFAEAMKKMKTDQYLYGPTTAESYLTNRGLINRGDLSYTPKAHDVIGWSGLTSADKKAIGFGVNPFEDTRAAGQWNQIQQQQKKKNQMLAWQKMKQKQMAPPGVFPKSYISAADVAKKKATVAQQVQQNIQTYGNRDRPNTGMNAPGAGKGQSPTGGDVAGTPFVRGGRANYFDGGLLSLWPR